MLTGSSVYDGLVEELMGRLEAEGIIIVVVGGNKNNSPIEYATALKPDILPRLTEVLDIVSDALKNDLVEIRKAEGRKP